MIGFPLFSGFISKILFAQAAVDEVEKMLPTLIALALSTILNVIYFMRAVLIIYTPTGYVSAESGENYTQVRMRMHPEKSIVFTGFILLNLVLGLMSQPIVELCSRGLGMFE